MKKQLLVGSALVLALTAQSQNVVSKPNPLINTKFVNNVPYRLLASPVESETTPRLNIPAYDITANLNQASGKEASLLSVNSTTINWKVIAGSSNAYGMLVSAQKPLQYNYNLNAVSFVHRASSTYTPFLNGDNGAMVAEISLNWGASWDSTCFWSSVTNRARYPQGAIYNPAGNTNINNAYIVGCGPVTNGTNWIGNWYASKQLGAANSNTLPSSIAGAQQFVPNTPPFPTGFGKQDFSRQNFSSTTDGAVRSIGYMMTDVQQNTFAGQAYRGAAITKGTFNAGVFTWVQDSIKPNTILRTDLVTKQLLARTQMAWNEAGTVGYVVFIGAASTATGSNLGIQPIVYKTTNSGSTWAPINGIDFNNAAFAPILKPLVPIWSSTIAAQTPTIPFFNVGEGWGVAVDANDKLHIASLIVGSTSNHPDSLTGTYEFTSTYPSYVGDKYSYDHTPGKRPYLYDFIGDGTGAWTYKLIDSLATENPGGATTDSGFGENPWDTGTDGSKIEMDSRIQVGRTPNGQFITYTWAESDTNLTNNSKKWNNLPNIKTRLLDVTTGSLSSTEINVTNPLAGTGVVNTQIRNRATLHYLSPVIGGALVNSAATSYTVDIKTPLTITNSNPYSQLTNNATWYSLNTLSYAFTGTTTAVSQTTIVGIKDNSAYTSSSINIFPNPAKNNATLAIDVKENSNLSVEIYNIVGALIKTVNSNVNIGSNKINLDLTNLNSGIYMANIKVGNTTSTKKLIIE